VVSLSWHVFGGLAGLLGFLVGNPQNASWLDEQDFLEDGMGVTGALGSDAGLVGVGSVFAPFALSNVLVRPFLMDFRPLLV